MKSLTERIETFKTSDYTNGGNYNIWHMGQDLGVFYWDSVREQFHHNTNGDVVSPEEMNVTPENYDIDPVILPDVPPKQSVLHEQHGGDHYKTMKVQPWEIINEHGLNFYEGNALKYLLRHRNKNGAEDIKKAIHYLQAVLEFDYDQHS